MFHFSSQDTESLADGLAVLGAYLEGEENPAADLGYVQATAPFAAVLTTESRLEGILGSVDRDDVTMDLIDRGRLSFTVDPEPYTMGFSAIDSSSVIAGTRQSRCLPS